MGLNQELDLCLFATGSLSRSNATLGGTEITGSGSSSVSDSAFGPNVVSAPVGVQRLFSPDQLVQLQLMTLEMELAKMLAPKLVALDLDPLLLALESDLPHMDLALWDQLDFEWARRNCSLDQPPVDLAKPKGEDAGSRTAS